MPGTPLHNNLLLLTVFYQQTRVFRQFFLNVWQSLYDSMSDIPFQCGGRLYTSDVCRRQILTYKDDPRTERINVFILAVDP